MDGDRNASFGFVLVELIRHALDGLKDTSIGRSEDTAWLVGRTQDESEKCSHKDTDGILIDILHGLLGVHDIIALFMSDEQPGRSYHMGLTSLVTGTSLQSTSKYLANFSSAT